MMKKLIVTLAPTGNVPTRETAPAAPLTPDEIVREIKDAEEMGVAVAHIHVRDENLKPTTDRSIYKTVLDKLDEAGVKLIRQLSTGARGATGLQRGAMLDLPAEMASLSTGSSNFAKGINANDFELIEALADRMYANNIKPEIEVFDASMITNAVFLQKKGVLKGPLQFNLVMNVPGSITCTPRNLQYLVDSLPEGSTWQVSGIGSSQVTLLTIAIAMGGNVRTGLEDVLTMSKGVPATHKMLVERVLRIAEAVGRPIATADEAREYLSLT